MQEKTQKPARDVGVVLKNLESGSISGVEEVGSFSHEEILLKTPKGTIKVAGSNLEIISFDRETGELAFSGEVFGVQIKKKKAGFLERISK